MRRFIPLLLVVLCVLTGCNCLPEPAADSSPPTAGLIIEWRDVQGDTQSLTISALDSDVTVTADKDYPVAVIYMGSDPEGMRRIDLAYDMVYYSGTSVTRPLLLAIDLVSSCPRKLLTDAHTFEAEGYAWTYTFAAESENWIGLTARSATVTVDTE